MVTSPKLFSNFLENTKVKKIGEKIKTSEFFTYYGYYFNKHYIYLLTQLIDHPAYSNYILAFDLKFDPEEIINLEYNELVSVYYEKKLNGKSFNCFKKIKLNKQPAVLDFNYSINRSPYNEIGLEELKKRKDKIKNEEFLGNFKKILITESENYETNYEFEEETIYSEGINFSDKIIMEDFDKVEWEKNGILHQNLRILDFYFLQQDIFIEILLSFYQIMYFVECIKRFQKDLIL